MKKVIIMRGLPGSGKSYHAKELFQEAVDSGKTAIICSADDYFMVNGVYTFNSSELKNAHQTCRNLFLKHIEEGLTDLIIVDNTNTKTWEYLEYLGISIKHPEYSLEIHQMMTPFDVCLSRQTHNVPTESLKKMQDRFEKVPESYQKSLKEF